MSNIRVPSTDDLKRWVEAVAQAGLDVYLPGIDEAWFQEMASCFEVAVLRPDCSADVCRMGSVVFHKIIKNHYRVDGNKRSAVICTYLLFFINGLHLDSPPSNLYALAKAVAENKESAEEIVDLISKGFSSVCKRMDA